MKPTIFEDLFLEADPLAYTGSINRKGAADNDTYTFVADTQTFRLKLASMYKGLAHRYTKNHQPTIYWLELVDTNTDKAVKTIPMIHKAANVVATMAEIIANSLKDNQRNPFAVLRIPATGVKVDVVARIVTRYVKLFAQKFEVTGVLDVQGVAYKYIVIKRKNVGEVDLNPIFGVDSGITLTSIMMNQEGDAAKAVVDNINKNVRRMQNTDPKTDVQDTIDIEPTVVAPVRSMPLTKAKLDDLMVTTGFERVIENIQRMMIQDAPDLKWVMPMKSDLYRAVEQKATFADAVEILGGTGTDLERMIATKAQTAAMTTARYAVVFTDQNAQDMLRWADEIVEASKIGNNEQVAAHEAMHSTFDSMAGGSYSVWEILAAIGRKDLIQNTGEYTDVGIFINMFANQIEKSNADYKTKIHDWRSYNHIAGATQFLKEYVAGIVEKYGIVGFYQHYTQYPNRSDISGFDLDMSDPEQMKLWSEVDGFLERAVYHLKQLSMSVSKFSMEMFDHKVDSSFINDNIDWLTGLYKSHGLFGKRSGSEIMSYHGWLDKYFYLFVDNNGMKSRVFGYDEFDIFNDICSITEYVESIENINVFNATPFSGMPAIWDKIDKRKIDLIAQTFPSVIKKYLTYRVVGLIDSSIVNEDMLEREHSMTKIRFTDTDYWVDLTDIIYDIIKTEYPKIINDPISYNNADVFKSMPHFDLFVERHSRSYINKSINSDGWGIRAVCGLIHLLNYEPYTTRKKYDMSFISDAWAGLLSIKDDYEFSEKVSPLMADSTGFGRRSWASDISNVPKNSGAVAIMAECMKRYAGTPHAQPIKAKTFGKVIETVKLGDEDFEKLLTYVANNISFDKANDRYDVGELMRRIYGVKSDLETGDKIRVITKKVLEQFDSRHMSRLNEINTHSIFSEMYRRLEDKDHRGYALVEMYKHLGNRMTIDALSNNSYYEDKNKLYRNVVDEFDIEGELALELMKLEAVYGYKLFNKENMLAVTKPREKQAVVGFLMDMIVDALETDSETVNVFYENMDAYFQKKIKSHLTGMGMLRDMVVGTELRIAEKVDNKRLKQIFAFNDIDVDELAAKCKPKAKRGETLSDYITRVREEAKTNGAVEDLKIVKVDMSADEVADINAKWVNQHRIGKHGNVYPAIKKVWDVHLPDEKFYEFKKLLTDSGMLNQISPAFHGTSGIAAAMILRYGFTVPPLKDANGNLNPGMAGRMLGNGVYFATHIDKALLYACPDYNKERSESSGYVFEMETLLGRPANGRHGGDYASAGGRDATSGAVIRTPEWCVRDPERQVRIFRCYEVDVVQESKYIKHIKSLRSKAGKLNETRRFSFMNMLQENIATTGENAVERSTWQFYDGKIPHIVDGSVEYLHISQIKFNADIEGYAEGDGDFAELTFPDTDSYLMRFERGGKVGIDDLKRLTALIDQNATIVAYTGEVTEPEPKEDNQESE